MKSLFATLLACFLVLAFALPGFAAAPVVENITGHINDVIECGSFQVLDSFDFTLVRRNFFDEAGNLVRREAHFTASGTISNLSTGVSYADRGVSNRLLDGPSQNIQFAGVNFHINVPGRGVVILDAGKFILNLNTGDVLFSAGPGTSIEQICAAMQ